MQQLCQWPFSLGHLPCFFLKTRTASTASGSLSFYSLIFYCCQCWCTLEQLSVRLYPFFWHSSTCKSTFTKHTHTHTPACLPTSLTLPRSFKQKTQVIVQWKNSLKQSFDWKSSFVDWTIQKRSIDHRRQPTRYPFSIFHNLSIVRQYRSWQSQFLCLSFNLCFTLFPP